MVCKCCGSTKHDCALESRCTDHLRERVIELETTLREAPDPEGLINTLEDYAIWHEGARVKALGEKPASTSLDDSGGGVDEGCDHGGPIPPLEPLV